MSKSSNVQLKSNVYPVKTKGERIDFYENPDFVRKVWSREALIRMIQSTLSGLGTLGVKELARYARNIPGIEEWQIRRVTTPDECAFCLPGEKPWGIVMRNGVGKEICRCDRTECSYFSECRHKES